MRFVVTLILILKFFNFVVYYIVLRISFTVSFVITEERR